MVSLWTICDCLFFINLTLSLSVRIFSASVHLKTACASDWPTVTRWVASARPPSCCGRFKHWALVIRVEKAWIGCDPASAEDSRLKYKHAYQQEVILKRSEGSQKATVSPHPPESPPWYITYFHLGLGRRMKRIPWMLSRYPQQQVLLLLKSQPYVNYLAERMNRCLCRFSLQVRAQRGLISSRTIT